ncbi:MULTISPECIES: hypothetical protein [Haloarcula]|uniref:hypothetical protein n=1 Tax=Haloarcula TaxID=2237 RepID=UPI0011B72347|nr:hypothetical protein [Haloarcula hispanica]
MDKGFLYVATGEQYIEEAKFSAQVTKHHMDLPITVISDREVNSPYIDKVIIDESPDRSFFDKPRNLLKSPYDKTIYMDGDVFLLQPVPELFDLLDNVDLATAIDPNEFELRYMDNVDFGDVPESVPLFQTGVIAYKQNEECKEFIRNWINIHQNSTIKRDQTSFRIAIDGANINHMTLSNLYNCLIEWPMQVTGEVKIAHGRLAQATVQDIEDINTHMNVTDRPRLFYYPTRGDIYAPAKPRLNSLTLPLSKCLSYSYSIKNLLGLFYSSYQRRGLIETLRRAARYVM